jgi:hypothetical protein
MTIHERHYLFYPFRVTWILGFPFFPGGDTPGWYMFPLRGILSFTDLQDLM